MSTTTRAITAEELLEMGDIGRCELIQGEVIKLSPSSADHGVVAADLLVMIGAFVKKQRLGKVYAAETGFILARNPDTVRAPDVAFVRTSRVPSSRRQGYFEGAPDLAVEVLSPSDRASEVVEKVDEWLKSGTVSVWVVDPRTRSIQIYRHASQVLRYRDQDEIRDEPTLPGFVVKVADIFESD